MRHVLLVSGGLDSSTIYLMKRDSIDDFIFFDYGHRFKYREIKTIEAMDIPYKMLRLEPLPEEEGFFFGRNLSFMKKIREFYLEMGVKDVLVYFGNCADDNYNDNSRGFLFRVEQIINDSYPGTLRIICPLENNNKKEIYDMYQKLGGKVIPYWCDYGGEFPCGVCHSCQAMKDSGLL